MQGCPPDPGAEGDLSAVAKTVSPEVLRGCLVEPGLTPMNSSEPLPGVPANLKNHYWTVDQPTRSGSHRSGVFQAASSVPGGFTSDGLLVGLRIVGRQHDDLGVLQASAAFDAIAPWAQHRPQMR